MIDLLEHFYQLSDHSVFLKILGAQAGGLSHSFP
jgi:hypothetical protein